MYRAFAGVASVCATDVEAGAVAGAAGAAFVVGPAGVGEGVVTAADPGVSADVSAGFLVVGDCEADLDEAVGAEAVVAVDAGTRAAVIDVAVGAGLFFREVGAELGTDAAVGSGSITC